MANADVDESSAAVRDPESTDVLDTPQAGAKAIRGGAFRVSSYAVIVLLSVASSALLFRHLGVVAGGHYLTILSLVTLTGGLTDAGLSAIGVRELATRDASGRAELMRSLVGLRMALSLLGVAVAVAFSLVVGYSPALVAGAAIAGVGVLLTVLQDTYAITLTAQLRIGWVAAADLLRQVLTVAAIVALVAAGAGLLPFWATSIPAGIGAAGLAGWLVRRQVPLLPSFRLAAWRSLLRDTLAYSLATAVAAAYFRVGIVVVSLVSSGHQTGYFAVPFRVIEVLILVPQLLIGATFPIFARAARDDHARLAYALGRTFDACVILGVGVALSLVVGAPFVIRVVGGAKFGPSDVVLQIQGVALMASFIGALWGYALLSLHRYREILVVSLCALMLSLILTSVLASIDGARGAAIGTTVSEAANSLMLGIAIYRTGVHPKIRWSGLPRLAVAAALGALSLAVPGVPDVVRIVLAMAVYGCALFALNLVPREILGALPPPFRRSI